MKRSVEFQAQLIEPEDPRDMVRDWLSLAQLQNQLEHPDRALVSLECALQILFKLKPAEQEQLILPVLAERALAQKQSGQLPAAMASYAQVLMQIDAQAQPLQWAHYALLEAALHFEINIANALLAATQLHLRLKDLETQVLERHVLTFPLLALAGLCEESADFTLALDFYNLAIRALERSERKADFLEQTIEGYEGRARCLQKIDQGLKAIQAYRQADKLAGSHETLFSKRPLILSQLGLCYQEHQKYAQAYASFSEAISLSQNQALADANSESQAESSMDQDHPLIRNLYLRGFLSVLYLDCLADAIHDFEQIEAYLPGFAAYDLACLSLKQGDAARAIDYLQAHLGSVYALSPAEIQSDPDFDPLYGSQQWQDLFD